MRTVRRMLSLLLALLLVGVMALGVSATSTTTKHNGLQVTIEMDKEQYDAHEPITATITVKNTSKDTVTIDSLEQLVPEGYVLSEDSKAAVKNKTLKPGKTLTLSVTMDSLTEEQEGEGTYLDFLNGETGGIPNVMLILGVVVLIALFMFLT